MSDTQNADDATADLPDNPTPSPTSASKPPPRLPPIGLRQPNNPLQNLPAPIRQLFGIPDPQPTGPQIAEQRKTQPSYPYSPTGPFPRWPPPWHYAKWQNYVPAQPRDHGQWGQPSAYPNPPARWENPGLYTQIGNFFSQNGSFLSGQNGILLNAFNGAYMKGVMQGQEALAQLEHTKMTNHLLKMEQDEQDQQIQYSDIFDTYGAKPGAGGALDKDPTGGSMMAPQDPNNPNSPKISLHDALWNKAIELHDTNMQRRMMTDGAAGAYKLLQDRDQKWQDLHASNVQRVKENEADAALAPFTVPGSTPNPDGTPNTQPTEGPPMGRDVQPSEGPPTAGPMPSAAPQPTAPPQPDVTQPQPPADQPPPEAPPTGGAAPGDTVQPPAAAPSTPEVDLPDSGQAQARPAGPQGVQVAEAGASDAPPVWAGRLAQADAGGATTPAAAPDLSQYRAPPVSNPGQTSSGAPFDPSQIDALGHRMLEDPKGTLAQLRANKYVAQQFLPHVLSRAQQLNGAIDKVLNSNLSGTDKYKAIDAIDHTLADRARGLISGRDRPPTARSTADPTQELVMRMVSKIDPAWTYGRYDTVKDATIGKDGRDMAGFATANGHVDAAIRIAKELEAAKIQNPALGPWLNKQKQNWQAGAPPMLGGDPKVAKLVRDWNYEIALIAPELARAQKQAAPTQGEINEHIGGLDASLPMADNIGRLNQARELFHQRMYQTWNRIKAAGGLDDARLLKLYKSYEQQGFHFLPPTDKDAVQPDIGAGGVTDEIDKIIKEGPGTQGDHHGWQPGDIEEYNGKKYRFKGGDNTQENWEPVQ